jgi:hypothetical protein
MMVLTTVEAVLGEKRARVEKVGRYTQSKSKGGIHEVHYRREWRRGRESSRQKLFTAFAAAGKGYLDRKKIVLNSCLL